MRLASNFLRRKVVDEATAEAFKALAGNAQALANMADNAVAFGDTANMNAQAAAGQHPRPLRKSLRAGCEDDKNQRSV